MNSKINHVVFIYHRFDLGGIETLILRAAKEYVRSGFRVTLFTRPGALLMQLDSQVEVVLFKKYREVIRNANKLTSETAVISFDPVTYMVMRRMQLRCWLTTGIRSFGHAGVFHPRAFSWPGDPPFFQWIAKYLFKVTPNRLFFFMSAAVRNETASRLNLGRAIHSAIVPLPIESEVENLWVSNGKGTLRIVSVGRLVPAKCYNRSIPKVVKALAEQGVIVQWDIWGDGEDREAIEGEIIERRLCDVVFLKGVLPYSEMRDTVRQYDVFVGLGTAVLEAATVGVPSVCAIDFRSDEAYGFLYEAPGDSIGEEVAGAQYQSIQACITRYAALSSDQRLAVSRLCKEAAFAKSSPGGYLEMLVAPRWPGNSIAREIAGLMLGAPYLLALDAYWLREFVKRLSKARI